jgi:hypothetical protein
MAEHMQKDKKSPEIIYDPLLVENIVYKGLAEREKNGDFALYEAYHEQRDDIYDLEQEMRPERFRDLDNDFFNRLGYDRFLVEMLYEFPDVKEKIEEVHVRRATSKENEGSNVVDDGKKVIIRLYSEQFIEGKKICKVLRHELMHVSDMLNEGFGYKRELYDCSPMEERIIRDRYRLFWDICVDGRLEREGRETIATREDRKKEFVSFFSKIPEKTRDLIFERMWSGKEPLTHNKMIDLSRDVKRLIVATTGNGPKDLSALEEEIEKMGPLPGTPCPLCGFPTFDWVEEMGDGKEIVKVIKEDFPDWSAHDSLCSRCAEFYQSRAGKR